MKQFGSFGWILVIAVYVLNAIPSSSAVRLAFKPPELGIFGLKLYHVFNENKVEWNTALSICKNNFDELLAIRSQREHDELKEILNRLNVENYDYWTSGFEEPSWGGINWSWYGNKFPMSFTFWAEGHPKNTTPGQCLISSKKKYKWESRHCGRSEHFICTTTLKKPRS